MSHHCHDDACSHEHAGHHHHDECCHHQEECCHQHDECCHGHKHKFSDDLLDLADEAWMEVLKEKIKEDIRKKSDKHLDKLAKLVSDSNHMRWKNLMEGQHFEDSYESTLRAFFHSKEK